MKLPPEARLVFKGVIFDVYQWQQKMYDGSYATFERLKRPNTIEVIAVKGDKIVLAHQSQPTKEDFYSPFGGRAEEGEDPLVTAKRELLEESGLSSNNWELYKVYQPLHKIDWEVYVFIARDCHKIAEPKLDAGEQIEEVECTFNEFIDIVLSDKYWGNELVVEVLRMKVNGTLEEFKKRLFGKSL